MGKHSAPVSYDDEWILAHWESVRNWKTLCEKYNVSHGMNLKYSTFKAHCNLGLGLNYHYSDEQFQWLRENYPVYGRVKCAEMFAEKFHEEKSPGAIKCQCLRMGLKVNSERRKERAVENTGRFHPVGTIRPMAHGEPYVKTENGWVPVKNEVIGKQEGKIIVFLDGNQNNVSRENLMHTTRAVSARMTKNKFWSECGEITKTGILCCELENLLDGGKNDGENV